MRRRCLPDPADQLVAIPTPRRRESTHGVDATRRGAGAPDFVGESLWEPAPHINSALSELPVENLAKLVQQGRRRDDDVLADAVLEEIAAGAARDEGGYQHVRIKEEFHDTRVNTSSSV